MRQLPLALLVMLLSGCATQVPVPRESPLASQLDRIQPGNTTREELRARLGEPWLTSAGWGAELYVDYTSYTDTVAIVIVPVLPYGRHSEAESLLVIFDEAGIVLGMEYTGATGRCGKGGCRRGDLRGIDVSELQVMLAPPGTAPAPPGPGECLVEVDAPESAIYNRLSLLYLDDEFIQAAPSREQARFRLLMPAGEHRLACVTMDRPRKGLLLRPSHQLAERPKEQGWLRFAEGRDEVRFQCSAGERLSFRLAAVTPGALGSAQYCGIAPVPALPDTGAREIIRPDRAPSPMQ
jgi:outer membrane protein assembly factor BamE (lipoprotein component of BamABCDE complex)